MVLQIHKSEDPILVVAHVVRLWIMFKGLVMQQLIEERVCVLRRLRQFFFVSAYRNEKNIKHYVRILYFTIFNLIRV